MPADREDSLEGNDSNDFFFGKTLEILEFRALHDGDPLTRKHAVYLLGQTGEAESIGICIKALRDPEKAVRAQAARALVEIGEPAFERLIPLFHDPDWKIRYRAAEALGIMKDRRAVEPLILILSDEKDHVRYMAAKSLGHIGDPAAREPLRACQQDENHYVRTLASSVVTRLSD